MIAVRNFRLDTEGKGDLKAVVKGREGMMEHKFRWGIGSKWRAKTSVRRFQPVHKEREMYMMIPKDYFKKDIPSKRMSEVLMRPKTSLKKNTNNQR